MRHYVLLLWLYRGSGTGLETQRCGDSTTSSLKAFQTRQLSHHNTENATVSKHTKSLVSRRRSCTLWLTTQRLVEISKVLSEVLLCKIWSKALGYRPRFSLYQNLKSPFRSFVCHHCKHYVSLSLYRLNILPRIPSLLPGSPRHPPSLLPHNPSLHPPHRQR